MRFATSAAGGSRGLAVGTSARPRLAARDHAHVPNAAFQQSALASPAPRRRSSTLAASSAASITDAEASAESLPSLPYTPYKGVEQGWWVWKGSGDRPTTRIRYQKSETCSDEEAPVVLLVHGFGGNCDHFRKNIGALSGSARVYSIDLLGYGYSDKPSPYEHADGAPNALYNFYTWADQLNAFLDEVVRPGGRKVMLVCNSVGSIAGLQAIRDRDGEGYGGIMLLNPSLRLLHKTKQAWFARPFVTLFQRFLRETPAGALFFAQVATPRAVSNILKEAYHDAGAVTDELVQCVLRPGLQPGAVQVFLDFLSYSGGPLPEELIPQMPCPVEILWGEKDPWEPIAMGRKDLGGFATVSNFVTLPGVGHCPMDEAPDQVNQEIERFVSAANQA